MLSANFGRRIWLQFISAPVFDEKAPYFKEAKLVLVCRKVAKGEFKPEQFIDKSIIPAQYPQNDFHYIYYGAIEKVLINE